MRKILLLLPFFLWTCGGGGSSTEPEPPQLPTVTNIEVTTLEDTAKTFALTGTDPNNLALTYSISTQPQHGTISISGGAATYTPNANYHGQDVIAFLASSTNGNSNIGTIIITITPVDDEPNSMDVNATTDEDNAIEITLQAEEYDGDNIEFQIRNNPSNGSATISGSVATYTPNQDWFGTDAFNFEAIDSSSRAILNIATAVIVVNSVNDAPVVDDISLEWVNDVEKQIELNGSDVEENSLTFSIKDNPVNGQISLNNNIITYSSTIVGLDSLTYIANDGQIDSNIGKILIDVKENKFDIIHGTSVQDDPVYVSQTLDQGYVILSNTLPGKFKYYLIKTDALGNKIWEKTYGNDENIFLNTAQKTSDGGFILAGWTGSELGLSEDTDAYALRLDSNGNQLWEWSFNSSSNHWEYINDIIETSSGNFAFTGTSWSNNNSKTLLFGKIDNDGDTIVVKGWGGTPSGGDDEIGFSITQTSDDGFLIGGVFDSSENILLKTTNGGQEEWVSTSHYWADDIVETIDGGFAYISGCCTDLRFVSTDNQGNILINQMISYDDSFYTTGKSFIQLNDGSFIIGGHTQAPSSSDENGYLVKIDSSGNKIWEKVFVDNDFRQRHAYVNTTNDDGFIIIHSTESQNNNTDIKLIKVGSNGNRIF